MPVIIKGSGFDGPCTVTLGGTPLAVTSRTITELQVTATSGTSGTFTVTKGGSSAISTNSFTRSGTGTSTLDLFVDGWYLTQSVQDYAGTVPLVASRDGLLRVFVRANQSSSPVPAVQAAIDGTPLVALGSAPTEVPVSIVEEDLSTSWDYSVPGSLVHAGMTVSIQVDPSRLISQADTSDDSVNVTLNSPKVNVVKTFNAVIVPVYQAQAGLTGNVSSTPSDWVDRFQRMYPVQNLAGVNVTRGSTYVYTGPPLTEDGTNWDELLLGLAAKRAAEGGSAYYFGAVSVPYTYGVAGLGLIGEPVAVGWDKLDTTGTFYSDGGNYPEVYAHEVGHNLGLGHAPCPAPPSSSAPSFIDPDYPYQAGSTGVWGWDARPPAGGPSPLKSGPLRDPGVYEDIMSYCSPLWISDFTYQNTLAFRAASAIGDVVGAAPQDCLLVTGQVKEGQVRLDPAFVVNTVPKVPDSGSHVLQLRDGGGTILREIPFEPVEIADLPGNPRRQFVLAVPLGTAEASTLAAIGVARGGLTLTVRGPAVTAAAAVAVREPVAVRMRPGEAHLGWDAMVHPRAMIRDPRTGEVLAFAEGGSVDVETDAGTLDVTFSDGVHSVRKLLSVQ